MSNLLTTIRARFILLALTAFAVFGISVRHAVPSRLLDPDREVGDVSLHLSTIQRIRAGEQYYAVVGDELRRNRYPTKAIFNWRTPLHYEVVAALSVDRAANVLFVLAFAVVVTGALAYSKESLLKALVAGFLLLGAMLPALLVRPGNVALAEIPTGVIIGLSLNAYLMRQWMLGASLGVAAVFLRELAVPYALVCGIVALRARRTRESAVWVVGGLAFAVYYARHAVAAAAAIQPGDIAHAHSWVQWQGPLFVFKTLNTYGWLSELPVACTPIAAALGLTSVFARSAPPQLTGSLVAYVALFCAVGQPFNYYWGFVTCALWAHAFMQAWDGAGALVRAALPTREPWTSFRFS